jgi:prepilin-type N-terminal cleavage/methylation domain-containing protein
MKNLSKGFTLIELLVVIAIIGILSGLIIVSMGGATNSAKDARIKSEMDQLRSTAIIFYNNNSTYVGFNTSTDGATLLTDINNQGGTAAVVTQISSSAYCIVKQLVSSTSTYWCVDSTGYAGNPTASGTCGSSNYTCK